MAPAALLTRRAQGLKDAREAGADGISLGLRSPAALLLPRMRSSGLKTFVWTIGSMTTLAIALYWHVNGIITDRPREVGAVLERLTAAEAEEFPGSPPEPEDFLFWRRKLLRKMKEWPNGRHSSA